MSSTRGRAISARPIATCCCSPPDSDAGPARAASARSTRKQLEAPRRCRRRMLRRVARGVAAPDLEVVAHRHGGKDLAPLRHLDEAPARTMRSAARPDDPLPDERGSAPRAARTMPAQRVEDRRLAGAVAAEQRHDRAFSGDARTRRRAGPRVDAVPDPKMLDRRASSGPRRDRPRSPRGRGESPPAVPSAILLPGVRARRCGRTRPSRGRMTCSIMTMRDAALVADAAQQADRARRRG